jgi:hypothetical protein
MIPVYSRFGLDKYTVFTPRNLDTSLKYMYDIADYIHF